MLADSSTHAAICLMLRMSEMIGCVQSLVKAGWQHACCQCIAGQITSPSECLTSQSLTTMLDDFHGMNQRLFPLTGVLLSQGTVQQDPKLLRNFLMKYKLTSHSPSLERLLEEMLTFCHESMFTVACSHHSSDLRKSFCTAMSFPLLKCQQQ